MTLRRERKAGKKLKRIFFWWKIKEIGDIPNIDLYQMEMILEE
jgi:hypothetical protein